MISELEKLHEKETFSPMDANKLTKKDRSEALAYLMFLTEKRDGIIKGRTYFDEIKMVIHKR